MKVFSRFSLLLLSAGAGAAGAALLDPVSGRRRRHLAADRAGAWLRRSRTVAERSARDVTARASGAAQRAAHGGGVATPETPNQETLADRVRTMMFRDPGMPKGSVNVHVERGDVVVLHGHVDRPEQVQELVAAASAVPGVGGVENHLEVGGVPAGRSSRRNRDIVSSADSAAERSGS